MGFPDLWSGCCWILRRSLTSQVISIAFYSEREKSDKFCSEALISVWGSFTCRTSTARDQRLYFPSEGSHTQDFFALKNLSIRPGLNPTISDPVASMITTEPENSDPVVSMIPLDHRGRLWLVKNPNRTDILSLCWISVKSGWPNPLS